jgi:signal transduction histidine kinase
VPLGATSRTPAGEHRHRLATGAGAAHMTAQEQCNRTTIPVKDGGPWDLTRFIDAVLTMGTGLDLRALLQRIVAVAVDLVDAGYGALGVLDHNGDRLAELLTVGDDDTQAHTGDLLKSLGLLGSLIVDGSPLRLAPFSEHPDGSGFLPGHTPKISFLEIPIRVGGEVFANLYLTSKTTSHVLTDVDEELAHGLAAVAGVAIENARRYEDCRFREGAMAAMNEVATAVLAGTDQRSGLELLARHARTLLGAEVATIALPDELFVAAGTAVEDVLGPSLIFPLIAEGQTFGSLTVARSARCVPFAAAELDVAKCFADQASVVLEHERVRQHRQRVILLEDQARVGRDLHDTVIQRLFAIGLTLQGAAGLLTDSGAEQLISNAIDELDRTIGHIRTVIFDIETSSCERATSMRAQIVELAHDAARGLGFQPRIMFTGTIDTTVAGRLLTDLLATVTEVLSNVIRHAGASHVDLELSINEAITLSVVDDGIGMPGNSHRGDGHGMVNIRTRAERLGGTLDVTRPASGGTQVRWRVPLLVS